MTEHFFIGCVLGAAFLGYFAGLIEQNIRWVRRLRHEGYSVKWKPFGR